MNHSAAELHVVTGAFGYSGKYIARRLLEQGKRVRTLTSSTQRRNPFGSLVEAHPYHFDQPDELARSLEGAEVLYNTYWVRFDHRDFTHSQAVQNTLTLFGAARRAGVRRIVHISITNPSLDSPLPYFRGKAQLEKALQETGLSYAILRPTVLFGKEDILINNIAWMLRKFPVFVVFGEGGYQLQPIYVDDLAELAVQYGQSDEDVVVDAIGPETFTYRELVQTIADAIGVKRPIISVPPSVGLVVAKGLGYLLKDVVVTREEVEGLMANLLVTSSPPAGATRFSEWVRENASILGRRYHNELARRRDRERSYEEL
ncbi:MAG: NAD-dependent epimerase/dehydratase family protein [Armatimonadota bacterium]|nr:NAD-dependent epimerase/dehydratase family protein [bacterium]MDW8320986.1 NAD-dependent epimerase/dehydratase family protein [Armatimonadota bacterium]